MTTLSDRAQFIRMTVAIALGVLILARHLDAFVLEQWFPGFYYPEAY